MRDRFLLEVFSEVIEGLIQIFGHRIQEFRQYLVAERADMYANVINEQGDPLSKFIGFIYCTKIQINRPGCANAIRRAIYSGQKLF